MRRKIAACFMAMVLTATGLATTGTPASAAVDSSLTETGENTAEKQEDPLKEIDAQDLVMEQQEEIEEEENMPAEDPDPLVIDEDGSIVPASQASWVRVDPVTGEKSEIPEEEISQGEEQEESGRENQIDTRQMKGDSGDLSGKEVQEDPDSGEFSDGNAPEESATPEETGGNAVEKVTAPGELGGNAAEEVVASGETDENGQELTSEQGDFSEQLAEETEEETAELWEDSSGEVVGEAATDPETFISDASEESEEFSDSAAPSAGSAVSYQEKTLQIKDGQDITAPLNTLFLKLKDRATVKTPYKIIVPPGNYKLTGTLCMYSNMYLYAQGAKITKTSTNKHLILRLGNTKQSEGGYSGYENIVIDGGTWDYNYASVADKDAPGGFVGFCIGHAKNVTFKNATFLNNLKSHFLEFGGVKNAQITGCTFRGYYKKYEEGGQECIQIDCCTDEANVFPQYTPYDGSTCEDFLIEGNTFEDVFAGAGTHSMMTGKTYRRITVRNNTFRNIRKRCVEFLNYVDSVAENNTMTNVGMGVSVITVSDKNAHQTKGYQGGPDINTDRKLLLSGNKIRLSGVTEIGGVDWVCSGVRVLGYNMEKTGGVIPKGIYPVKGITVKDNQISGYGNGIYMKLANTSVLSGNQIKMQRPGTRLDFGIYAGDSRGTSVVSNKIFETENTGIFFWDDVYGKNSKQKNYIRSNTVSSVGGDGIYLRAVSAGTRIEKNIISSANGSGIHVQRGKIVGIYNNDSSSNKNHGIKIEDTAGGIWIRGNQTASNKKSGLLVWDASVTEIVKNTMNKNSGNGMYLSGSTIGSVKENVFAANGKLWTLYAKSCKGRSSVWKPVCKTITTKSTSVSGTASGSSTVAIYVQKSGKTEKIGAAKVNKKKQFAVKIKKQKKNTLNRVVSKDKYGNTVTVNYRVK